jgi:methylated-DNA-[protein]-cysteine S-methyltransferase
MYALDHAAIATPIGLIRIEGDDAQIHRIVLEPSGPTRDGAGAAVRLAAEQLAAYFAGRLRTFDLPVTAARTPRGEVLRAAIIGVGHGQTASYGELATLTRSSARALGQACARNPFPLVVPCHRVLQSGGVLGPYSAGDGPATKRWLLDFER